MWMSSIFFEGKSRPTGYSGDMEEFRKWGSQTEITQNIKDLLSSQEIENIFVRHVDAQTSRYEGNTSQTYGHVDAKSVGPIRQDEQQLITR